LPVGLVQDIYLHPGEFVFSDGRTRIRTILGSCVAVTFWHPEKQFGAICHFMLPSRNKPALEPVDGRYGEEVIAHIGERLGRTMPPSTVQVKLFGGSAMLPELVRKDGSSIGLQNIEAAKTVLASLGFHILKADVGHCQHRSLIFDPQTGEVWVRRNVGKCEMHCLAKPEGRCPYAPTC